MLISSFRERPLSLARRSKSAKVSSRIRTVMMRFPSSALRLILIGSFANVVNPFHLLNCIFTITIKHPEVIQKRNPGRWSGFLISCIPFVANDIFHRAFQHLAEGIQGFCADCFALFDSVECISRKTLLKNQMILCYSFAEQRIVKWFITYHSHHRFNFIILNLLTILNILSIIVFVLIFAFKTIYYKGEYV